jgi:hypothetical protein
MSFTHTLGVTYRTDAGTIINTSEAVVGTKNAGFDMQIMPGVTSSNDVAIAPSLLQSLMMFSDQPTTIMTNDPHAPQDTITLKANVPLTWTINSWFPVPFQTGAITLIYITNTGPSPANVKIRLLSN